MEVGELQAMATPVCCVCVCMCMYLCVYTCLFTRGCVGVFRIVYACM